MTASTRAQVLAHLADFIQEAEGRGLNGIRAAMAAFPGTPDNVIILAAIEVDERREEEWWGAVERTIDAEVIKVALLKGGGE